MALLSVSIYCTPGQPAARVHIIGHGVHDGAYGDLWERRFEIQTDATDARSLIRELARALQALAT